MAAATPVPDEMALHQAFAHYPSGLAALAAQVGGEDHVLSVATFSVGISLSPPLVSFAVQRTSSTWPLLRDSEAIGVSILSAGQDGLCRQLAAKDKSARWTGVAVERRPSGALLLERSVLSFECRVHAQYSAEDHEIVVLDVVSFCAQANIEPLVFHGSRFRSLEAAR